MKAMLVPLTGGPCVELKSDLLLAGRQANCDLRLDHKTVSKIHCLLVKTDGLLLLRDLGSTNGCRVNGQRVKRGALLPNDILSIAVFEYRVVLGPDDMKLEDGQEVPEDATEFLDAGEINLDRANKSPRD